MSSFQMLKLTHANQGHDLFLVPQLIFGVYQGPDNATWVVGAGNSIVPVKESVQTVNNMIKERYENDESISKQGT